MKRKSVPQVDRIHRKVVYDATKKLINGYVSPRIHRIIFFRMAVHSLLTEFPGAKIKTRMRPNGWLFVLDVPHASVVAEKITELR